MPSVSAIDWRNIIPVAVCNGVVASSVSSSLVPMKSLIVGSLGCACDGPLETTVGGAATGGCFPQPAPAPLRRATKSARFRIAEQCEHPGADSTLRSPRRWKIDGIEGGLSRKHAPEIGAHGLKRPHLRLVRERADVREEDHVVERRQ